MKPDEMLARRLVAELGPDIAALQRLAEEFAAAPRGGDSFSLRARASILHDFYTGVERILVRIAEELNGGVPRGEQWHRQLLQDMTLDLPDVRPQVVTADLAAQLSEFLQFRRGFRNVYGFVLEAERLRPLEERFPAVLGHFLRQVEVFRAC